MKSNQERDGDGRMVDVMFVEDRLIPLTGVENDPVFAALDQAGHEYSKAKEEVAPPWDWYKTCSLRKRFFFEENIMANEASRSNWIAVIVALIGGFLLVLGFLFRWPWG